ncbi:uncharacterized protein LOC129909359 [Episyrphus balteatus]|uniref:uncharacterized protein LOC129909359 n=1 Tax=Episyrphus balteatus TaxID=286459 RepID=UPI002486838E|nr:uncharacterized protein LOC129909359 [Episyrphus balteatus]
MSSKNMDNKTKYKMSSQMRLNEISRPTANIQCDHHHRTSMYRPLSPGCHCHHMPATANTAANSTTTAAPSAASVHPPSSSSLGDSSSCICSHHYHYIQHHRPNSPANPRTSTPPLPPPLLPERIGCCQSTCEDNNDRQISGATHVAVTVHQHQHHTAPSSAAPATQQASQHSLHHQYQALDETTNDEHEDCECCEAASGHAHHANTDHPSGRSSSRLVSADEIIPSGSEDNAAILQRCCQHNHRKSHRNRLGDQLLSSKARAGSMQKRSRIDEENYSTGIEVYSDGADSGVKVTDGATSEEDQGPPLPPRPPPRPRNVPANFNRK